MASGGFKAIGHSLGISLGNVPLVSMHLPSTYATAVYRGDPVVRVAAGSNAALVNVGVVEHKIASLPEVNRAAGTDGAMVSGVIAGFEPTIGNIASDIKYGAASTVRVARVIVDPFVIYRLKDDGASALDASAVGLNALFEFGTADAVNGVSACVLDTNGTAPSADASNPIRIVGLNLDSANTVGAGCYWNVVLNQHTEDMNILGI